SEAVLYQRFGSKDDLFFAAMRPQGPDIAELLGPEDPPDDARAYLRGVVLRVARHMGQVIPLSIRVMTHPSFDPATLARAQPRGGGLLQQALAERLAALARRQRMAARSAPTAARLLLSLAHDWALASVFAHDTPQRERTLMEMVDLVWQGLRPRRGRDRAK